MNASIVRQGITVQKVRLTPRNVTVGSTVQQEPQHARRVQLAHSVSKVLTTLQSALQGPIAAQAHQYALCVRLGIFVWQTRPLRSSVHLGTTAQPDLNGVSRALPAFSVLTVR